MNTNPSINRIKRAKVIALIVLSFVLVGIIMFSMWWNGCFIPGWVVWNNVEETFYGYEVNLTNKKLSSEIDMSVIDSSWKIQNMIVMDIDRDSFDEMILLVWKHGSYGEHRPFWEKSNDIRLEQHIFIYKGIKEPFGADEQIGDGYNVKLRPIWMSSSLGDEIFRIDPDERNTILLEDITGKKTNWEWRNWGLKLL